MKVVNKLVRGFLIPYWISTIKLKTVDLKPNNVYCQIILELTAFEVCRYRNHIILTITGIKILDQLMSGMLGNGHLTC